MRATTMIMVAVMVAGQAMAKPHLRDVAEIDDALLDVGLADEIRKNCPDISARLIKATHFIYTLRDRAREMGYSDAEIKAYRTSDAEKARLRAEGNAWLAARGVDQSKDQDWCRVGREEIAKGSRIGGLLRVN